MKRPFGGKEMRSIMLRLIVIDKAEGAYAKKFHLIHIFGDGGSAAAVGILEAG